MPSRPRPAAGARSLNGPGGIGKTALAIRAAESDQPISICRIIFLASKERELTADGQRALGYFVVPTYLEMLNAVASWGRRTLRNRRKVNAPEFILRALRDADVASSCSITFETLLESDRHSASPFSISSFPRGSSAIVTSRRRADASAVVVRLDRLDWEAAHALLAELGRDFPRLSQASDADRRDPLTRSPAAIPFCRARMPAGLLVEGPRRSASLTWLSRGKSRPSSARRAWAASQSSRSSRTTTALASARRRLVTIALEPRGRRLRKVKSYSWSDSGRVSRVLEHEDASSASRRARRMSLGRSPSGDFVKSACPC